MSNPRGSDGLFDHTGESDSLILTIQAISDKNILTQGNSDPNLNELLHIFSLFHLLPINPHPTQGLSDRISFYFVKKFELFV